MGTAAGVKQDVSFALRYYRLQKYWNSSPYYIGDESVSLKSKYLNVWMLLIFVFGKDGEYEV